MASTKYDMYVKPENVRRLWQTRLTVDGVFEPFQMRGSELPTTATFPISDMHVHAGGNRVVSSVHDFARVLAILLNYSISPITDAHVLSDKRVAEIMKP